MQSSIVVDDENLTITGDLSYATGIAYAGSEASYDGHFLALNISTVPSDGVELYAFVSNAQGENGGMSPSHASPYTMCTTPIIAGSPYSGYVYVSARKDGFQTVTRIYDCTGLILE